MFTRITICLFALLTAAAPIAAADFRLAAGAEVIPLRRLDLDRYNTGYGLSLRGDIVWGSFSATSIELGYRRFDHPDLPATFDFELHRLGLLQRFYPLFATDINLKPYLGLGITASHRDHFTLRLFSADYAGVTLFTGCEIPLLRDRTSGSEFTLTRVALDPVVRWQFDWETDYFYSSLALGAVLVWTIP